jgi:bifunctional non-homologous end joining protein LigD
MRIASANRRPPVDEHTTDVRPMLASIAKEIPHGDEWAYEPKYDGIRILAFVADGDVALVTRNGNRKTAQFPEVVDALRWLWRSRRRPFVLDGEIVALSDDAPARFQALQARMHVADASAIALHRRTTPVAYVVFDLLLDDGSPLVADPWHVRRHLLQQLLSAPTPDVLRLSDVLTGSPRDILADAAAAGWEGVIAKRVASTYHAGKRTKDWLKLKVEHRQEFVVGGYTEPRNSRQHFGAILLGYYDDDGRLVYAGHTGGGFSARSLADLFRRLGPLEQARSPFTTVPRTNERAHWVKPALVVEVRFNEWTSEGKLRQPIFVGVRDDKEPEDVRREAPPAVGGAKRRRAAKRRSSPAPARSKTP